MRPASRNMFSSTIFLGLFCIFISRFNTALAKLTISFVDPTGVSNYKIVGNDNYVQRSTDQMLSCGGALTADNPDATYEEVTDNVSAGEYTTITVETLYRMYGNLIQESFEACVTKGWVSSWGETIKNDGLESIIAPFLIAMALCCLCCCCILAYSVVKEVCLSIFKPVNNHNFANENTPINEAPKQLENFSPQ